MTPSIACEALIQSFEKCRLQAYLPTPDDVWTVGWGSTGPDIAKGVVWSQAQADERFAADLAKFAAGVAEAIGDAPTSGPQFDALVSLAYNIGLDAFGTSTLLKHHREGDHSAAASQFARWNKQNGKVLNGLVKRRTSEARLYRGLA